MFQRLAHAILLAAPALTLVGCEDEPDLITYDWDVVFAGYEDLCNDPPKASQERFTYALLFDGSTSALTINGEGFANGTRAGCTMDYQSAVIGEDRDGGAVQWQLTGTAYYRTGGESCNMDERVEEVFGDAGVDWATYGFDPEMPLTDVDWVGIETFTIVGSEVESIPLGCTYSAVVSGVYLGEF
ncbi:MAG: hypothetical protein RIT28_4170 [Pseudomonadota bacterium]|jgi:hypothetical protein